MVKSRNSLLFFRYSFVLLNNNIAELCWPLLIHKSPKIQLETISLVQYLFVDENELMKRDVWCYRSDMRVILKLLPLIIWHLIHTQYLDIKKACISVLIEYFRQFSCANHLLQLVESMHVYFRIINLIVHFRFFSTN
jgi:hypothetical protein